MWIVYGLLSALTAALLTIVGKVGLKSVDPTLATAVRSLFMFLFMTGTIFISGKAKELSSISAKGYGIIVIAAVFGALSWLFYFLGLKETTPSKLASLDRLSLPLIIILSLIFLGESLNWKLALGGILVTIGAIFVAIA